MNKVSEFFLRRVMRLVGIPGDIFYFIRAFITIGHPSHTPTPKELIIFNMRNIFRGLFTRFVVSSNLDWVWPYWIVRQFYPKNKEFVARGFEPVTVNVCWRNWTGIGTLKSEEEATLDPRGLLTPFTNGWSIDDWLIVGGKVHSPSRMDHVTQKLFKNLPMVITEFSVEEFKVKSFVFAAENEVDVLYRQVTVKNTGKKVRECSFGFAVRPYNNEGVSLIHCIEFPGDNSFFVNGKLGGVFMQAPDEIHWSNLSRGDVALYLHEPATAREYVKGRSRVGMATAMAEYVLVLQPGQSKTFELRIPLKKHHQKDTRKKKIVQKIRNHHFDTMLDKTVAQWEDKLYKGMQIQVPEKRVMDAFIANKAYLLMFQDNDYITPGPSIYHHFWFRDATYMLYALDLMGYPEDVSRVLMTYPRRQKWNGDFYSQAGEWDSSGEAIWTLMQHYKLTRDQQFLRRMFGPMSNAAHWIIRKKWQNKKQDPGYKGLMPPGLSAEHFGLSDYYYWDDFWALAGIRGVLQAAKTLRRSTFWWEQQYTKFYNAINTSLTCIEGNFGKPIIPISPSRRMDSAAIGSLSSYYPLRILSPDDIRLRNTIDWMYENNFIGNGFFHDVNHAGYGTYLTLHVAECYLGRRDTKALDIFNWILDVASATWTWPEAINPQTFGGTMGDGHHGWAVADLLIFIRNLFFFEEKERLVITPVMPASWQKRGARASITEAPSEFGKIGFEITADSPKKFTLRFEPKFTVPPTDIEWNLPGDIKSAKIDGKRAGFSGRKIYFAPSVSEVEVTLV